MKTVLIVCLIIALTPVAIPAADDGYFFIVVESGDVCFGDLAGFPGRLWGTTPQKVFLSGDNDVTDWLNDKGIEFRALEFDIDLPSVYIWYLRSPSLPADHLTDFSGARILDRGEDYVVALDRPTDGSEYRRLHPRSFPARSAGTPSLPLILEYDPVIDGLVSEVNEDSIFDFLSRLSGAAPINIDGGLDTIRTRFSGTPDNELACRFLKETLESYGYEVEFHGFYGGNIRHIASNGDNLAWLVTEDSEALRTTDGGANWILMPDGVPNSLWGIDNSGADSVWIAGNNGVIRFSSNGGQSFSGQSSGVAVFLFGVDFISSSQGWIAGDNGTVLRTSNGGQNWSRQTTSTGSRLYDICFIDSDYGWAVGRDGAIIHTTNGGANWATQVSGTSQRIYGVDFIDRDNGWAVGWAGVVRRTTNGGANWLTVDLGTSVEKYHVEFTDPLHGCIAGWNGEIFITTDGGESWLQQTSGTLRDFYGLSFADNLHGYAAGNGVLMKTSDGGQTWISQTQNIESSWRNVIAIKPGTVDPDQQVIICAHMDDTSQQPETLAPGADDNGSGTTGVIEAARVFADMPFEKTILYCLWSGEEQGLLGSAAYAEDAYARGDDILGVYNFDMIAWDGNGDGSIELHCGTMGESLVLGQILNDAVSDYNIALDPEILTWESTDRSDHASFWDYGYPAILGIEDFSSDFNPYYHSTSDNISHIMLPFFFEFTKSIVAATATFAIPDTEQTPTVEPDLATPKGFALNQNYPNPFNNSTVISFRLEMTDEIDLSIFDITGREVEKLFDGTAGAGDHSIKWQAEGAASGVYFCRLRTTGGLKAVGRMTLIK